MQIKHAKNHTDDSRQKLRILFCCSEQKGTACSEIRVASPLQRDSSIELRRHDDAPLATLISWADVAIIQRNFPSSSLKSRLILRRLYLSDLPLIYETDDDLLQTPESNPHHKNHAEGAPYLRRAIRRCDAIIVSTNELASRIGRNKPCFVVPNLLDNRIWQPVPIEKHPDPIRIGFSGSPTHLADLALCENALEHISKKHGSRVAFTFLGCYTQKMQEMPNTITIPFSSNYSEYAKTLRSAGIHIGIAPLSDNNFNRTKSAIKWLEMSACGIAGVYSNLPPYQNVVHGRTGLLVSDAVEDWFSAINILIEDAACRISIASNAQDEVYSSCTLDTQKSFLGNTIRRIIHKTATNPSLFKRIHKGISWFRI